ncbi:hypothetical protein [Microbacterium sp. RURRCA19A]|uniref:hypothetical protein n=1 Tax=Microbacterium sp. RURRCA19A TaxID=1907391 RepID=UPI0009561580|nr:hypothetical protein [Microbacterium sp. RURRCA19A]SIR98438.1 hypothetical protein SAMN05880568_2192 [Microbacterium sp. RURRCA19A]
MVLSALRDDALHTRPDGYALRLSLPWIRSLPLAGLVDPEVRVDGRSLPPTVMLGDRRVDPGDLTADTRWWHLQDRVVLHLPDAASPGIHEVSVSFRLEVPYLEGGPDGPLRLPFFFTRRLDTETPTTGVSRDVGSLA